jgi:hypothetical protein
MSPLVRGKRRQRTTDHAQPDQLNWLCLSRVDDEPGDPFVRSA